MRPLDGKVAMVTGAARRIGKAIARALAREGAAIVVHCRQGDDANDLVSEVSALGARWWVVTADLAKVDECESLVSRAVAAAGSLHLLVNNASVFRPAALEDVVLAQVVQDVEINAWAPFVLTRTFAREVGRGGVVNMLDTRVGAHDPEHLSYLLSKEMLASLTRACALAYAPEITVNAVAPGVILPPAGQDNAYLDRLAMGVPLERRGDPEDVASAVVYLATSGFVTGQVIHVDGGQHLMGGLRGVC